MFEKFPRKPKIPKIEEEKGQEQQERIVRMGGKVLEEESNLEIKPERSGGYMLCTILATALAMGMAAGKAEAQVKGVGPQGQGFGRQMIGEIFHQGVSEAGSAIDRSQNAKRDMIEQNYVAQLTKLENEERQLDHQYAVQKRQLSHKGALGKLETLERDYKKEKTRIAQVEIELKKEYRKQIRNMGIKKEITESIFRGIRGW